MAAAKAAGVTAPQTGHSDEARRPDHDAPDQAHGARDRCHKAETLGSEDEKAKLPVPRDVSNAMLEIRAVCDELETIVADDFWPLPKYREMLFLT